jgi:hypothetical protein
MVQVEMKGIFPAPRDKLWKLLRMHPYTGTEIHPMIISQKILSEEGDIVYKDLTYKAATILEQEAKGFRGKTWRFTAKAVCSPPEKWRAEVLASDGLIAKGSYWENTYTELPEGTLISTKGEITLKGVPRFLQRWIIRRFLNTLDKEDLDYLRKINL